MAPRVRLTFTTGLGFVQRFNAIVKQESVRGVNEATTRLRRVMVRVSPFGGTGLLKQSWITRAARAVSRRRIRGAVVAKGSISANVIEKGAKKHFPPVGVVGGTPALGIWIRRKMGITDPREIRRTAFNISRKFNQLGVQPKRTFSLAFGDNIGATVRVMENMSSRIKERF